MLPALLYNLLLFLLSPLGLLYLAYRLLVLRKSREGLPERLGWSPRLGPPPPGGRVWFHAVSAGEAVAAAAVVRRLRALAPDLEYVVSCTTPAGRAQLDRLLPEATARFYFPFDLLPCVLLALLRVRPTVVCPVETEIWPNWLFWARTLGCRAALVNGQIADKGFQRARRGRWLYGWALHQFDALWMQTERAAERARFLGGPSARIRVAGNVKFEQQTAVPAGSTADLVRTRLDLQGSRRLWIAGSTHPGEETELLAAFRQLRGELPDLVLLLAPRHVQRAPEVLAEVRAAGFRADLRSAPGRDPVEVLVLDTMGELSGLYALADVVFVGGSLAPIGGHDILQPLFFGKPVLFGPHMHNQHDLARLALEANAVVQVADGPALVEAVRRLLTDAARRRELEAAGRRLLTENAGAAQACAAVVASLARQATGAGPLPELP